MFKGQGSALSTTLAGLVFLLLSAPADAASRDQLLERFRTQCIDQYSHLRGKEQPDVLTARISNCIGNHFKTYLRQAAAAPVSPRHELKVAEFTPWLAGKLRGPDDAKGAIFYMRGSTPSTAEYRAGPYYFKSLSENGWDIFGGMMPRGLPSIATEYVPPIGAFMLRRAEELKREGYRRVVLGGHSMGAWAAARVAENAGAPFDAILLSAPAVFGTRISPFTGKPNPTYELNLTELGPLLMKVKKPTFLIVPDDREYDPDPAARGAIAEKIFTQAKLEHIVLTKPPGFSGHIASSLPIFDYAYGKCIQHFIESLSSDTCQVPPLSNSDFRSIVHLDQVAGADHKRVTSAEPLVGKKYIVYSLQSEGEKPNVRELAYLSANQRQSLEIDGSPREKIAFRDGLHCTGTKCSILVKWAENQLLEFDAKSQKVSAWWAEE